MIFVKNAILLLFIVVAFLFPNYLPAFAAEIGPVPTLEEIDLPQDFNFSVSDSCSGHIFFNQAVANEAGYFAVYSLHADPDNLSDVDFTKVYIDIYLPDGTLLQELSFTTQQALTMELEEKCINLYFYDSVFVYNFVTQELSRFEIPAESGHMYAHSSRRKFKVGEWEYTCKKGYLGYVQLTRNYGEQKQVLLELPGYRSYLREVIIPGNIAGGLGITAIVILRKKRKAR